MTRPPITQIPNAPSRQEPENFSDQSAIFFSGIKTFEGEVNALGTYIDNAATEVSQDASDALVASQIAGASKDKAILANNVVAWVSGGNYSAGNLVWSPLDFETYRAKTTHSGLTTDPSLDTTNWTAISLGKGLEKTSDTGSVDLPAGTVAQRDVSPDGGYLRFNSDEATFEGYNGTAWGPIGRKGSQLEAVATGTLPDGSAVIVNTDGTVSVVAETEIVYDPPLAGTPSIFATSISNVSATYDSTNNKVVIAYSNDLNSNYGTAVVGTVSGTSISFGTAVVFRSASCSNLSTTYDSTNNKIVIAYRDGGNLNYGRAVVGTVSGTSISFGTTTTFESASTSRISATYDITNNRVVIAYTDDGNFTACTAVVGTVSGTSISFGTPVVFSVAGSNSPVKATYDSTNSKVVIAYRDFGNSDFGTAVVGTVSGTSISFGTPVVFESAATSNMSATYDSTNNKVVIAYQDGGNTSRGTAVVGTVSGTSISFGTPVVFVESGTTASVSATYDSTNNKVVIAYQDGSNSNFGTAIVGTVSGTSISFGTPVVFETGVTAFISAIYDSTNNKPIIAYEDVSFAGSGTTSVLTLGSITTNLTTENFIGFSEGSYTNSQTATINIVGATTEAQTGLTAGQSYYVQADGTLADTPDTPSVFAGTAISSTKLIVKR